MTTYSFTITLNDSETIMRIAALNLRIKHCQEKLDAGAPYCSHGKYKILSLGGSLK